MRITNQTPPPDSDPPSNATQNKQVPLRQTSLL